MVFNKRIVSPFFFACLLISLSACSGHYSPKDTYVSRSGALEAVNTDRTSCLMRCNAEYDRCGDTSAAHSDVARGRLTGVVGAQADCSASLRSCLKLCRGR